MLEHTEYKCNCSNEGCQFCAGGLFSCTCCGGFEGTLTTECPGHTLNKYILEAVYQGGLDFKNGKWKVTNV